MTLIVMLTTATAWAFKTETVSYSVSRTNNMITISGGGTTTSWKATNPFSSTLYYWAADDEHNLSNGMKVKPSDNVSFDLTSVSSQIFASTQTETTFTLTTTGNIAITGVKFKHGNDDVVASSTQDYPSPMFTVTLASGITFTGFEVTYGYISGACGGSATWSLARQNKKYSVLTIGGSGAMSNYDGSDTPWDNDLTSVTIGSGITAIGNNAFNGCSSLTRVDIEKTGGLVALGTGAFSGCNALASIVVPTPALAVQYKTATNWSDHAAKLRVPLGDYLFTATDEGGTAAYAITNETDLRNLASANDNGDYQGIATGKTFRQTANISLGSVIFMPIGNSTTTFTGTYDGGNYTISGLNESKIDRVVHYGLFGYVKNGTVRNVRLVNPTVSVDVKDNENGIYCATLVGGAAGSTTVENCVVINPTVQSNVKPKGAIIGRVYDSSITLRNLYFYGGNLDNAVYTASYTIDGRARRVTLSGVTVSPAATDMDNGFVYNDESYYLEGLELTLARTSGDAPEGYTCTFSANGNALSGNTYTVNSTDADVTLTAAIAVTPWEGSGTEGSPFIIRYPSQLDLLAHRVNGTHGETADIDGFNGKYFRLAADITYTHTTTWDDANSTENNYEAIGRYDGTNLRYFKGHFDGAGHTISGIRIYCGGDDFLDRQQGIFGKTQSGANIHGLRLADARITGFSDTGGIVGQNNFGTVADCHVANDVCIHAVQSNSQNHGGIAGYNLSGTVERCTSAATLTIASGADYCLFYGGIAGSIFKDASESSTLRDNLAICATVPAAANNTHGAIAGNNPGGTFEHNFYTACNVAGQPNAIGKGCGFISDDDNDFISADVTKNDGAVPALRDQASNSTALALLATLASTADGHTPLDLGWGPGRFPLQLAGRKLYKDGDWNTLCLPFNIASFEATPLEGATVKTLTASNFDNGTLTLTFGEDLNCIEAGKPYLVKWEAPEPDTLVNPVFTGVIVSDATSNVKTDYVNFVGTYNPVVFDAGTAHKDVLFLGGGSTLYYPSGSKTTTVKACCAYFTLNGITAGDPAGSVYVKDFVLNFDDADGLNEELRMKHEEFATAQIYDLSGRQVDNSIFNIQNSKLPRGVYIVGRKKILVNP